MLTNKNSFISLILKPSRSLLRNSLVLATLTVCATGCVTSQPQALKESSIPAVKDENVAHTSRETAGFMSFTPGKAVLGIFGVMAMSAEGNRIVAENHVEDPAAAIGAALASTLSQRYGAHVETAPVAIKADDPAAISTAVNDKARYIVDVETMAWGINYFSSNWTHYRLSYNAKARLINTQSKSVIAEGFCKLMPTEDLGAPTYDELMANQAALLKETVAKTMAQCIATLQTQMFPG